MMRRWRQFLLECLAAIFAAGLLLAAALPLLSLTIGPVLPPMTTRIVAIAVVAGCVLLATLREGGSLRE